jgi:hypothetical protein
MYYGAERMEKKRRKLNRKPVKVFQEISKEINIDPKLKNMQPTPQPADFEEIEY